MLFVVPPNGHPMYSGPFDQPPHGTRMANVPKGDVSCNGGLGATNVHMEPEKAQGSL